MSMYRVTFYKSQSQRPLGSIYVFADSRSAAGQQALKTFGGEGDRWTSIQKVL